MVQSIGFAGESLAAGAIFTLPAMFIWMKEWGMGTPSILEITFIALSGELLGVLFLIPLRKVLIVKEHGVLTYHEGTACAEVFLAGEEGGEKATVTFIGLGVGAVYKLITDGLKLFPSEIETEIPRYPGAAIGADVLPALLRVVCVYSFNFKYRPYRRCDYVSCISPYSGVGLLRCMGQLYSLCRLTGFLVQSCFGDDYEGMIATLTVGAIIYVIAAIAAGLENRILGRRNAKKQQIGEFVGGVVLALAIGYVLILLNNA
ncbi:OPT/YSL family transporter [Fusibacter sp. JL298sf-3]